MTANPTPVSGRFTLYASSRGSAAARDIRELLEYGLKGLGVETALRDERGGFDPASDWHVVVAPHEFFHIGAGVLLKRGAKPSNLILLNVEPVHSDLFMLCEPLLPAAKRIWDTDRLNCAALSGRGLRAGFLPLGYSAGCRLFRPVRERRELDVLFIGARTQRRERFFAAASRRLSRHRCCVRLLDDRASPDSPVHRAKIALNIHPAQAMAQDWPWLALRGFGQGAMVLTEPCADLSPMISGRDYIEATLDEIPDRIDRLISSGWERVARSGARTYSEECRLEPALALLLEDLRAPRARPAGLLRQPAARPRTETVAAGGSSWSRPLVTVAVTLYNYEKHIRECLDSVREQTLKELDLVVVDDCSTDRSLETTRDWLRHRGGRFSQWTLLRHGKNAGLAASRNAGFRAARSPYVFVLDADNLLYPPCLERLAAALQGSNAGFAYCMLAKFGEESGLMNTRSWDPREIRNGMSMDAMALVRKTSWRRLGGYQPQEVQGREDYDFYLRLAEVKGWGAFVPETLAAYRVHLRSMLHSQTGPGLWRLQEHFKRSHGVDFASDRRPRDLMAMEVYGAFRPPAGFRRPGSAKSRRRRSAALSMLRELQEDLF